MTFPTPTRRGGTAAPLFQIAPQIERVVSAFGRDLNVVLARGIRRMFAIALEQYRRALDERSVLDFSDVLQRALELLRRMDEFSQSRFRLESRYHHVLVDEFQDTSRAQWELVSLLVQSWGEGLGLATQPSIFIVGDRKQSIYRFRDAEVAVLQRGRPLHRGAPPGRQSAAVDRAQLPRRARAARLRQRAVRRDVAGAAAAPDEFTYVETDRFPIDGARRYRARPGARDCRGARTIPACAAAVAAEIARVLREETVRDRKTGVPRPATPGDIAILFRSRASHREFEHELERPRHPDLRLQGARLLRRRRDQGCVGADAVSRRSGLGSAGGGVPALAVRPAFGSGHGAARAPGLAAALHRRRAASRDGLDDEDRRVLGYVRGRVRGWLALVDRVPPADLIEALLRATAYAYELRGAPAAAGMGEPEEDARPDPAHPEPRLRDAGRGSPTTSTR